MAFKTGQKGMRKGTKSCVECRTRKVKCNFEEGTERCVNCTARGDKCGVQIKDSSQVKAPVLEPPKPRRTLEERVAQLETIVRPPDALVTPPASHYGLTNTNQMGKYFNGSEVTLRSTGLKSVEVNNQEPSKIENDNLTDIGHDPKSVGTLFNNTLWRQHSPKKENGKLQSSSITNFAALDNLNLEVVTKDHHICRELVTGLPPTKQLASIISATCSWWNAWRPVGVWFQDTMAQNNIHTLQEAINWTLASSEPAITAIGILSLATCLQQLDSHAHSDIILELPHPPGELFHEYFDRVNRLIISNHRYSSSQGGVEVMLTMAKIYMNLGLLKLNWTLTHRAMSHAQLIGIHRPYRSSPEETDSHMASRHESWFKICERDMYNSLLLDLPYAANWKTMSPTLQGSPGTLRYFQHQMMRLSSRIIDRNQMGHETSIPETQDIAQDMNFVETGLHPQLWDTPTALRQGIIDGTEYKELLAAQFWFFQAKVLLHQPLMILSLENHQYLGHREACIKACRETLRIYHIMRSDNMSVFSMVKLVDYQAFISSAILLLGLLGFGSLHSPPLPTVDEDGDWQIVQSILDILRRASKVSNNTMASQAVQSLETLTSLVESGRTGICRTSTERLATSYVKILVPGSGIITLLPGKLLTKTIDILPNGTATHSPLVFHLTRPNVQDLPSQPALAPQITHLDQLDDLDQNLNGDISMMDFDWTNMIGTPLEDDWAWLTDVNAETFI